MIEDTSKRDPLIHLLGAMSDGSDSYITGMEAAGQRELVNSDRLPVEGRSGDELRALGFELGEPDPADPLFRPVTLPEGWRREGSDHAMWSYIVDRNGRKRVAVFYKAAPYDRKAHYRVNTIAGYVDDLLWCDEPMPAPIVDEWTTRDLLVQAITEARAEEDRDRVARCDRLLAQLVEDADRG